MGISLVHTALEILLIGTLYRIAEYLLLNRNPESLLGKFLAFAY